MLATHQFLERADRPARTRGVVRIVVVCLFLVLAPLVGWLAGDLVPRAAKIALSAGLSMPMIARGELPQGASGPPGSGSQPTETPVPVDQHQYWQVGLMAGPEGRNADGMRATIVTRLPEVLDTRTTDYFWEGSYLADGSFVQAGYYVPWYSPQSAGWFYCSFATDGRKGPCAYGPEGSAGSDGAAHIYTLAVDVGRSDEAGSEMVWQVLVDDAQVGQFVWSSDTTGPNSPSIYAEASGFSPHAATNQLGPVDFPAAVQIRTTGHAEFTTADHMRPVYNAPDVCPPYGVSGDGGAGVLLGSGLPCLTSDGWLR